MLKGNSREKHDCLFNADGFRQHCKIIERTTAEGLLRNMVNRHMLLEIDDVGLSQRLSNNSKCNINACNKR